MTGRRVIIVGGGLAGLAAAVGLTESGLSVRLLEARRQLGGRAGSFAMPAADDAEPEQLDHCQHVGMGCCTNLIDFFQRTGNGEQLERFRELWFLDPTGRRYRLRAAGWLPAPLHLLPSFLGMRFLTWRERAGIGRGLLKLARLDPTDDSLTIGEWLKQNGQSESAIRRFWSVVLVSALSETVDRASVAAARKVFVDGFLAARHAYELDVPRLPLGELYDRRVAGWLADRGVEVSRATRVERLIGTTERIVAVQTSAGQLDADQFIVAVPWTRLGPLFGSPLRDAIRPTVRWTEQLESTPIASLHLWFDRPLADLPQVAFIDRLTQWVFCRTGGGESSEHYYQIVISAATNLSERPREDILNEVLGDLQLLGPAAAAAQLLRWRMINQADAVFSPRPGIEAERPGQSASIANLAFAGDWTRTGWPATMESAVRSGYLAAEVALQRAGQPSRLLAPDLPRGWLSRLLLGAAR